MTPAERPLRLGFAAPMFAAPGIPTLRTPSLERLDWAQTLAAIREAEALGYDSVWFSDHLFHGRGGEFLESWTTLAAAAGATERIRLVNNHLGINYRPAPLLAKMAATIDVISAGRFELFVSHGMREREHTSYGFGWEPDVARRVAKLDEAIEVMRSLWSGKPVDHDGEHYRLRGALSTPVPAHPIPLWLGGPLSDPVAMLIAARADGWNALPASLTEYAAQAERVDAACRAIGRDPSTLRRSLETQVLILGDDSEWNEWMLRWAELRESAPLGFATSDMFPNGTAIDDPAALTAACVDTFIIGTRREVAAKLAAYRDLGVDEVVCWFMDWPVGDSLRSLAEDVRAMVKLA
ncbi:LLM class flavin-dependent oxidoreductase [Microbacterium sp. STN6]|uniref:LLM class flavin-dependent oxidoreductase n=1 Tax=Microbacterium sp. STN6 TaxID=2995588 RepID=UPI002260FBE1|nr:LLM class flavin-dependent oxidoreductase [Microbacterium sp. STN6]MCX7522530.1 LLM class flavin-dependent oxidoreductase [Microbacterium sp. STN6]